MFGLTAEKLALIAVVGVLIVGPQRLPGYASALARWARSVRAVLVEARTRVSEEIGPEFDEIDWRQLDPRRYDPRRVVREAWQETDPATRASRPNQTPATKPEPHPGEEETP